MALTISVYRDAGGMDCTNNGITSRFERLTLVNADGPFNVRPDAPAVLMEMHVPGCLRLVPAVLVDGIWKPAPDWHMFGGNYGATSDSRFGELARKLLGRNSMWYGAVAIHDRVE